jgi:hypothetical protein
MAIALLVASPRAASAATPHEEDGLTRPPLHYLAVTPSWTHAFAPRSASRDGAGLALEVFLGRRMSVLAAGTLYAPFTRREPPTAEAFPLTETLGSLIPEVNVTLLRGERGELAVGGGVGLIATRPVSVVDPDNRKFAWEARIAFSAGATGRLHLTSAVALALDLRSVNYVEQLESRLVDDGSARRDRSAWYGDKALTNRFEARLGATFYFGSR